MTDGPEWFAPKRFGYGAGLPIAWQGWALLAGFTAFVIGFAYVFANRPLVLVPVLGLATYLLLLVSARTTRGGWKWRGPGRRD